MTEKSQSERRELGIGPPYSDPRADTCTAYLRDSGIVVIAYGRKCRRGYCPAFLPLYAPQFRL